MTPACRTNNDKRDGSGFRYECLLSLYKLRESTANKLGIIKFLLACSYMPLGDRVNFRRLMILRDLK